MTDAQARDAARLLGRIAKAFSVASLDEIEQEAVRVGCGAHLRAALADRRTWLRRRQEKKSRP
jgi:hypothetical protein